MQILASEDLLPENKNSSNKMLPPVGIDSKSNTVLSELFWYLLLRRSRCKFLFKHHLIFGLGMDMESTEHDYIRNLKSHSGKQMLSHFRKERNILGIGGQRVEYSLGITFYYWIFFFA